MPLERLTQRDQRSAEGADPTIVAAAGDRTSVLHTCGEQHVVEIHGWSRKPTTATYRKREFCPGIVPHIHFDVARLEPAIRGSQRIRHCPIGGERTLGSAVGGQRPNAEERKVIVGGEPT
jgi:hypothetical protein